MRWLVVWPLILFVLAGSVSALTLEFNGTPTSLDENQEFAVDINLNCSGCSGSYLRGVFYPSGTSYFGFTKNNSGNWINLPSSGIDQYYYLDESDMHEGSWSGKLVVKLDREASAYNGPGNYFFKVGRYTSGGSATWGDAVTVSITGPSPTSTPPPAPSHTPSPTHTPTPSRAPTGVPASKTPAPTTYNLQPTTISSKTPTLFSSAKPTGETATLSSVVNDAPSSTGEVLFASDTKKPAVPTPPWGALAMIIAGVSMIGISLFFFFKKPVLD